MAGQFVIKQIAQEVISEVNQPLYIGGKLADGSDAKITVASNGNVSTATPLTVPSLTVASKPVMSSLLAEYTVTGSPVTSIDFSGLDINTHKSYRIEASIVNPTSGSELLIFVNGDNVSSNYYSQEIYSGGSTTASNRSNNPRFGYTRATSTSFCFGFINRDQNGYFRSTSSNNMEVPSGVEFNGRTAIKTATVTNITQLTFTSAVANAIGVGSTIRIFRGDV